jgi:hypothetical protein
MYPLEGFDKIRLFITRLSKLIVLLRKWRHSGDTIFSRLKKKEQKKTGTTNGPDILKDKEYLNE